MIPGNFQYNFKMTILFEISPKILRKSNLMNIKKKLYITWLILINSRREIGKKPVSKSQQCKQKTL